MKRKQFEQYLRQYGCFLHHHGGGHDAWRKGDSEVNGMVPRHAEIKPFTIKSICELLGIPKPPQR